MILSHTHKFIFICSSKVGTTSMEEALQPFQEGSEYDFGAMGLFPPKHVPPAILRAAVPERIWRDYFKFVFVRNPWDWFVSQWFYNRRDPDLERPAEAPAPPGFRGRVRRSGQGVRAALSGRMAEGGLPRPQPPRDATHLVDIEASAESTKLQAGDVDTLFELLKPFRGLPGKDGTYQSSWLYDMDGRLLVDYVGRFETLPADFAHICEHVGLDVTLPHLNQTVHKDYRLHYTEAARQRVGELWSIDVHNLRYAFDGPAASDDFSVAATSTD